MGGQMQQSNVAATALYEHPSGGAMHNVGPANDAGDAVMARWLQSAGLQHLASPLASTSIDHRLLPNLLMQGYGAQSSEEKQRLFKLMRNLNFGGESGSEPYIPTAQSLGGIATSDAFFSPEFRSDFGAGLLDLHAVDDTELLSEHVISEPFEPSPFMPAVTKAFDSDFNVTTSRQQKGQTDTDASVGLPINEKENNTRENNVAKIKVVVRKRPLNKKEIARKEEDIVTVYDNAYLIVHEPKLKVDLTAYVEKHEFCFDAVLDELVTNDEVYRVTVEPIIPTIFQRTKATCFAYGQTGSGKTFTMQPLPLRAVEDLLRLLHQPTYRSQRFKLWLSFFEIYGGKLFDLLSDRKKLCMREDGRQQVCIVGLQEFEVSDVQIVKEFIDRGNAARSTGSTGANEESSRSHAILQLVVKKHNEIKDSKRNNDANESKGGKVVGKISFIDLAGSERGADTTDNDRQTRIEGAEINKSLLALKECIRALDNDQIHIPFRGSKLTEVLRDSFVGNSRTVMISCISPNAGSCEHTLNTLRYADRVKSLSKSGNVKKDQVASSLPPPNKESSSASSFPVSADVEDVYEQHQEVKAVDAGRTAVERENPVDFGKQPSGFPSKYPLNGREESSVTSGTAEKEKVEMKNTFGGSTTTTTATKPSTAQKLYSSYSQNSVDTEEKMQKVELKNTFGGSTTTTTTKPSTTQKLYSSYSQNSVDTEERVQKVEMKNTFGGSTTTTTTTKPSTTQRLYSQNSVDTEEKVQKASSPRKRAYRDEKLEKLGNWVRRDGSGLEIPTPSYKQQNKSNSDENNVGPKQYEPEPALHDGNINEILEEEEALIAAHRKEIENTMEIVREEMKLLAEVDQPGSRIDNYVSQLSFVLSRKAAGLVGLQARLARFQHRLKEQEILSRKRVPR
ncbi:kinesin-like protein KIN-13A isoform X2 [Cornus florida]|uniref:kinesin-like protein KIN-13A isoform X2 n=1 Tax=Cornus florida TaxID=4283 RepID=UPI00289B1D64|nr:kinesin-like protein KIN-13A isoform X2 [Cornus florida]